MDADFMDFLYNRIYQLRMQKERQEGHTISKRKVSMDMGQGESYIGKLERREMMPTIIALNDLCNYYNVSLSAFFDVEIEYPAIYSEITDKLKGISPERLEHILLLVSDIAELELYEKERNDSSV